MNDRRSFVLVTVLVVVMAVLLAVTSLLFLSQAELAGRVAATERVHASALSRSGLLAVVRQLELQREELLAGRMPQLDDEIILYETLRRAGVVRLMPLGPDGETIVAEPGRLDLNRVDADMLAATELVEVEVAQAIIAYRDGERGGAFASVAELLRVPGVTGEILYGPLDDVAQSFEDAFASGEEGRRDLRAPASSTSRGLADVVTVFAYEPAVQRDGVRKINLNVPWSETLGERLDERFGDGAGQSVKAILDQGTRFEDEGRIYAVLRFFNVPVAQWPDIVDAITTDVGPFHYGRLDVNRASAAALAAVPGFDREMADEVVRRRDSVDDEHFGSPVWPVLETIVDAAVYEEAGSWLTARSFVFRVRLAAGEVDQDDPASRLVAPAVIEAVIDVSEPTARLAYVRDVTLLPTAIALMAATPEEDDTPQRPAQAEAPEPAPESPVTQSPSRSLNFGGGSPSPRAADTSRGAPEASHDTADDTAGETGPGRRRQGRWRGGPAHQDAASGVR